MSSKYESFDQIKNGNYIFGSWSNEIAFRSQAIFENYINDFFKLQTVCNSKEGSIYFENTIEKNYEDLQCHYVNFYQVNAIYDDRVFFKKIDHFVTRNDGYDLNEQSLNSYLFPIKYLYLDEEILELSTTDFYLKYKLFTKDNENAAVAFCVHLDLLNSIN